MTTASERRSRVLRERAERLARAVGAGRATEGGFEIALVAVGQETFGIPVSGLREITPLPKVARLPGLPPYMLGVTQVRGELVCVTDLGRWFGIPTPGVAHYLVLLDGPRGPLGFTVERVLGFREVHESELGEPGEGEESLRPVRGMTRDLVGILDLERLLESPDLIVQ